MQNFLDTKLLWIERSLIGMYSNRWNIINFHEPDVYGLCADAIQSMNIHWSWGQAHDIQ